MSGLIYSLKKHSSFSKEEIIQILITALLGGFYFSFNKWGYNTLDLVVGFQNLFSQIVLVGMILFIIVILQKVVGIMFGYKIIYNYSWLGLLIGFFVAGLSNGFLVFFLPGGLTYKKIKSLRLGKFHSDYNFSELFLINSLASIIPLVIAMPFGVLYLVTSSLLVRGLIISCLLMGIYSLIPIPQLLSPNKWLIHGITDLKIYKFLIGGTFGYDLFMFSSYIGFFIYLSLISTVLVYSGLVYLFQAYSIIVSFVLGLLMLWLLKIFFNYLKK